MLVDKIKLEENEKILIKTRRHWFILWSHILVSKVAALLPLAALLILYGLASFSDSEFSLSGYWAEIIFVYCLLLMFAWIAIFSTWTNHYLDVLTITDRRAVLIDQKGFFWRTVTSFRLERLQDINIEVSGLLATLLDYGTLELETASYGADEFKATGIPKPADMKGTILQAVDARINALNREGITNP